MSTIEFFLIALPLGTWVILFYLLLIEGFYKQGKKFYKWLKRRKEVKHETSERIQM
jgi:uncharacterized protein HemY